MPTTGYRPPRTESHDSTGLKLVTLFRMSNSVTYGRISDHCFLCDSSDTIALFLELQSRNALCSLDDEQVPLFVKRDSTRSRKTRRDDSSREPFGDDGWINGTY
jgi:hypothetical protein